MTLQLFICKFDVCVDATSCYLKETYFNNKVFNGQLNVCDIKMHLQNTEEASVALITLQG